MSRAVVLYSLVAALALPVAVHAGAVYVPQPPLTDDAAALYRSEVTVRNVSAAAHSVLASKLDGASRDARAERVSLAPGETRVLRAPASSAGLLAFSGDADLLYEASLESGGEFVVELPVITADRAAAAGSTLSLSGLFASASTATNIAMVNLASGRNRCALSLANADGVSLGPVTTLTLAPLENRSFVDVFEYSRAALGEGPAQASISCDGGFFAFALVEDRASGRLELVDPVAAEASVALGATLPMCPTGATCFDSPGLVFVPAAPPGAPVGRVTFPAPPGEATRFRLTLDVTVGPWYTPQPSGKHLIYWFVLKSNPDMPGMLYFRGPGKNQAMTVHGLMLKHAQKRRKIVPFAAQIGHTYHVDNDYDLAAGTYVVTVTDVATGQVAVTLRGTPNLSTYTIKRNVKFLVDMGFPPNVVPIEVPSYGWKYADLHIEAYLEQP